MRTILCATILITILIASAAQGATWKTDRSFVNDATPIKPADAISAQPYYKMQKSDILFLRPTDTSVNQRLFFPAGGHCHWDHGTTGAVIGINDVFSGVELWILKNDVDCSSAGATAGECSITEISPGYLLDFVQKTAGSNGSLVCVGY